MPPINYDQARYFSAQEQAKRFHESQKAQAMDFMNGKHYDTKPSETFNHLKQTAIDINPDDLEVVL